MREVKTSTLKPGMVLHEGIYTRTGVRLLGSGIPLTQEMCDTLARSKRQTVCLARSASEMVAVKLLRKAHAPVPLSGRQADADGSAATTSATALDRPAGLPDDDRRRHAVIRRTADDAVTARLAKWDRLPPRVETGIDPVPMSPGAAPGWPSPRLLDDLRAQRVESQGGILQRLAAREPMGLGTPLVLVDELMDRMSRHPDRYAQLALIRPPPTDLLADHSFTTGALAIGIALRLGWSAHHVRLAGLTGLLADAGMTLVPAEARHAQRPLNEVEVNIVRRHPQYTVVLLDSVRDLPEEVQLAAYQHHERPDGSGYPRALRAPAIHDIARVVAVADTFAGATGPRPYRPRPKPFTAVEHLIEQAAHGRLWRPAVRALIELCGLFPVGSYVRLSTGQTAVVIANSDPRRMDRPTVRKIGGAAPGEVIDLAAFSPRDLSVVQTVDAPGLLSLAAA